MQTLDRAEERETAAVLAGTRALVGISARSLAAVKEDVTLPQYRVLVLLDGLGPQTMGELAGRLDVSRSTITRACDVLVDKRLVRRRPAPADRRNVCAELSAKGRRLVAAVMQRRRLLLEEALGRMSSGARHRLAVSLAVFAVAAGEVADDAWTFGWELEELREDDGE